MLSASRRRLDVFRAVVEKGGINAAADWLEIAQPSVTAHVAALESMVGTALFVRRRGKRNVLTRAGEALYRFACDSSERTTELHRQLRTIADEDAQHLTLAVQRSIANHVLPPIVASFLKADPDARLSINSETQEAVRDLYRSGAVDAAILFAGPDEAPEGRIIGAQALGFVVAPGHRLAGRRGVSVIELSECGFVGGLRESQFYGYIRSALLRMGLSRYEVVLHLQDSVAVKNAVIHGVGIACTLLCAVRSEVERGELVLLDTLQRPPALPVQALIRPEAARNPKLAALVREFAESGRVRNASRRKPPDVQAG